MARRVRLVRVVPPEPVRRYATIAEVPDRCPRVGCGALMRPWPDGKVCSACGRVAYAAARGPGQVW